MDECNEEMGGSFNEGFDAQKYRKAEIGKKES